MNDGMENNLKIKGAIIKVVAFFGLFDWPLTVNEIWQNLSVKCSLAEVMEELEKMEKPPLIPPFEGGQINLDSPRILRGGNDNYDK